MIVRIWTAVLEHRSSAAGPRSRGRRPNGVLPPELLGRIAPTGTEGINLRRVFRFPVECYADKILRMSLHRK
jgi:hypothetical protein